MSEALQRALGAVRELRTQLEKGEPAVAILVTLIEDADARGDLAEAKRLVEVLADVIR